MKAIYNIADRNIEISSIYPEVHTLCKDYASDGVPDYQLSTDEEDILYEEKRSAAKMGEKPCPPSRKSYLETLAVYRKLADFLLNDDVILFHGSVIAVDNQAYLFTAKSGTGKSTHTRLWREYLKERAVMVNDDKPLLKIMENQVIAYGTPWNGKHHLGENIAVPLKSLCILRRGQENQIHQISRQQAYAMLVQQVHKPDNPEKLAKTLNLIDKLAETVSLYELYCNRNPDAAAVSYNAMKG